MEPARKITNDIEILPSYTSIPGFGVLPVNSYVIKAREPVLVDTGLHVDREQFMQELESVIDPAELKWLWLTHPDQDHVGALRRVLERAPNLRVITTFLGVGIMSVFDPLPLDRVWLLNPGESIDVGDRTLVCLKPPTFDNPATTAAYDTKSRALFSSDCFGGLLQSPAEEAYAIPQVELRQGQVLWATIDAPWLHSIDRTKLGNALNKIREIDPVLVLSSHLPPARGMLPQFLEMVASVPAAEQFVGPNQPALEQMLMQLTH